MKISVEYCLLAWGVLLLAISALLGFVQHRYRAEPEAFARWRVVHAGGTAGAVQLMALSASWQHLALGSSWGAVLAYGLIASTWAFFLGPLARAMGFPRVAGRINTVGAVIAVPAYLALPLPLLF
jgi:hypothetical protein